jgi:hypothetical protein
MSSWTKRVPDGGKDDGCSSRSERVSRIINIGIVVFNDVTPLPGSQNGVLKVCNDNYLYS